MSVKTNEAFLKEDAIPLLAKLKEDAVAKFGIMTPQHMVEHLIWVTKTTVGRKGEKPAEPTKSNLYFQNFIATGAKFKYRPKEDATLKELKYGSLQEAIDNVAPAIARFYQYFEADPNALCFNPLFGEMNQEQLEVFHAQHFRWHLYQFGLMEEFV